MLMYLSMIRCNIKNTGHGLEESMVREQESDLDNDSAWDVRIVCLQICYNIIYLPHKAPQEMKSGK